MENFQIKKLYFSRKKYLQFDDTISTDMWQLEVYLLALGIMKKEKLCSVIDIGCGSGYKLITYLGEYKTLGLEVEPTLSWLKENYPNNEWELSDFSNGKNLKADVLICADVIEHLLNPNELINFIKNIDFKYLVLSTPERGLLYKPWQKGFFGPPFNKTHIREWSFKEFRKFIEENFEVLKHQVCNLEQATQVIVCKKR